MMLLFVNLLQSKMRSAVCKIKVIVHNTNGLVLIFQTAFFVKTNALNQTG